ncbi:MAG TPA: hypothetical protein VLV83_20310 [Acidobacteriota bacterium]|nr:hypothetical protein [Acidobacteriota bacterium]
MAQQDGQSAEPRKRAKRNDQPQSWTRWMSDRLGAATFFLAAALAFLVYVEMIIMPAWPAGGLSLYKAVLGALLLVTILGYLWVSLSAGPSRKVREAKQKKDDRQEGGPQAAQPSGDGFPDGVTLGIGLFLVVLSVAFVYAFFLAMSSHDQFLSQLNLLQGTQGDETRIRELQDAFIAMLAAGVGACISTILAYLQHASEKTDFKLSYAPWYVGRPLMGLMLGLVFYFLLKGGFLATVNATGGQVSDFNDWGLAGVSALVGLFTKNAVEKLREVFQTLFRSGGDGQEGQESDGQPS